ncbi:MAG: AAA family ATPase [Pirellulaceae bacterium]|nr:AAA family ATPase [Pirellulaceae bacterium]
MKQSESTTEGVSRPSLVCMADIDPRPITWVWPQRIAAGRITLAVGMPGAGKSFLTCDLASRVSTGTPWPDGSECQRGSVVFITAEDDPHDTIRPRLDALGADVSRIHLLSGVLQTERGKTKELTFTLADADILRQTLETIDDCRLVVIDPIGSFLGGRCDSHRDNEVRAVLAPIAKLAEQHGPAVLMVAHRRKSAGAIADDTAMGSRAFTGIARSVWHLSRDTENRNRRLLLPGKCNLAAEQTGLAFTIAGEPASVNWESDPVPMTADDALVREKGIAGEHSAIDEAKNWLREALAGGPKPSGELKSEAKRDGVSWRTAERAKASLGVCNRPNGFGGQWVWAFPDGADSASLRQESPVSAKEQNLADSGETVADSGEGDP